MRLVLLAVLLSLGCGKGDDDGGDGTLTGEHAARCQAACGARPADGPCSTYDEGDCGTNCVAQTEGLSVLCVQCMIEEADWSYCECYCEGSDCALCCSGDGCFPPGAGSTCDASEETCDGLELGSVTGDCAEACSGG